MSRLIAPAPPNLPLAPREYSPRYHEQLNNVLRLYFLQLSNVLQRLVDGNTVLANYFVGAPGASAVVFGAVVHNTTTFERDMHGSMCVLGTAATAETDFDMLHNGVSFGTMRFAVGGTSATFVGIDAPVIFLPGDTLSIVAPGSPDATAADLFITIVGYHA